MKYIIFGGGPCGMRLADNLSDEGHQVELYERKDQLGGCWKVEWKDGYFTEHSPRVMTTKYSRIGELVEELGLKDPYRRIYGTKSQSNWMFFKYALANLSFLDTTKFSYSMFFLHKYDKRNLQEWMDENNITTQGKKGIRNLSLSFQGIPEELSAYAFFKAIREGFGSAEFIQFRESDEWLKKWEEKLNKKDNVKIVKECHLTNLVSKGKKIIYARTNKGRIKGDVFLCAFPLHNFQEMIKECEDANVKNNWMEEKKFIDYCKKSSYSGIGVQLHFKQKLDLDLEWCQTCFSEFGIILLETSKFNEKFTKKKGIKTVLSCALVDFTARSSRLDKKMVKMTYEEIGQEVLYQLNKTTGLYLKPEAITVNVDFNRKGHWELRESAFGITPMGPIPQKGNKIDNLYLVGCQNYYEIAILDNALRAADDYCEKNDI
tara:strand:- start:318 stop:1613 length:1296 start_codon:yes stop_codon:yes gene_type:complete